MRKELLLGLLFFGAVAVIATVTIVLGEWDAGGYAFTVTFREVSGLEKDSKVFYHGYKIGRVKDVAWTEDGTLIARIRLLEDVVIPSDVNFEVKESSFFGGTLLAILDGAEQPFPLFDIILKERKVTVEADGRPLAEVRAQITRQTGIVIETMQPALDDTPIPGSVADRPAEEAIRALLRPAGLTFIVKKDRLLVSRAIQGGDELVARGGPKPFLDTLRSAIEEVERTIAEARPELQGALESLNEVMDKINKGEGTIGKLVTDPDLYEQMRRTAENLGAISEELNDQGLVDDIKGVVDKLNRILEQIEEADVGEAIENIGEAAGRVATVMKQVEEGPGTVHRLIYNEDLIRDFEEVVGSIARGEGTIGRLVMEDTLYVKTEQALDKLYVIEEKVETIADRVQSTESSIGKLLDSSDLYDNANKAMQDLSQTLGVAARTQIAVGLSYRHAFERELGIGKLYIRLLPRKSRYFLVGGSWMNPSSDGQIIFDEDDRDEGKALFEVDVQIAQVFFFHREDLNPWNDVTLGLRAGIIEGKVGGGLDLDFLQAFRWTLEARDSHTDPDRFDEQIDTFLLRSEVSVRIWKYFRIYAGAENIAEDAVFLVGAQVEWFDEDIRGLVSLLATAF